MQREEENLRVKDVCVQTARHRGNDTGQRYKTRRAGQGRAGVGEKYKQ